MGVGQRKKKENYMASLSTSSPQLNTQPIWKFKRATKKA